MYNLDEEKIECTLDKKEFFLQGKKADKVFISDVETRSIYLSLTLGTAVVGQ